MIPVRMPADAKPVIASDRVFAIEPDHPLAPSWCPACDEIFAGTDVVLVFVGFAPQDRKAAGWTNGAAVAVHKACAAPGPAPFRAQPPSAGA